MDDETKLMTIVLIINKYYLALDKREHGGVAQDKALRKIQEVMGMSWEQGAMKKKIEDHPELKLVLN